MIKSILIFLPLLFVSCLSEEDKSLDSILNEATKLTFMYMDVNNKKEILTWVIPIERSELRKRLSSAVQVENKFTMGISSNNGTFKNGNKTFNISLITVKSVERPCLIRVSEVDKPETQKSFIIKGEKAKEVQYWLDNTLEFSAKTLEPIKKEKVKSLEEVFRELE